MRASRQPLKVTEKLGLPSRLRRVPLERYGSLADAPLMECPGSLKSLYNDVGSMPKPDSRLPPRRSWLMGYQRIRLRPCWRIIVAVTKLAWGGPQLRESRIAV